MQLLSVQQLARLTRRSQRAVRGALSGLAPATTAGVQRWDSAEALNLLYGRDAGAQERARLASERANFLAQRNASLRSKLVRADVVGRFLERAFEGIRARLQAIPAAAAPEVRSAPSVAAAGAVLRRHISEALDDVSELDWDSYRGHVQDDGDDDEPDA